LRLVVYGEEAVVRIRVSDNGPGLPRERQATAFAWPPVPGETPGALGLGLQVSRGLVIEAGGTFAIEAPPAGGTAVVVTLPRLRR
jgi:C4-dicarboxylate-specific signal transduction histidine kinase